MDIGKPQRVIEVEPETAPAEAPSPEKVPAPAEPTKPGPVEAETTVTR